MKKFEHDETCHEANVKKLIVVLGKILIVLALLVLPAGAAESKAKDFIKEAAQGGLFEVEAGNLAISQASNPDVKDFGNQMVSDHGKANQELAQAKGLEVPKEMSKEQKGQIDKLKKASGSEFDRHGQGPREGCRLIQKKQQKYG